MKLIDLISIIQLIVLLFLVTIMQILIKRGKLKPEMWPRVFGIGTGVFGFVSLMITSILLRPISKMLNYTVESFFWSLVMATVAYFGGRTLASRSRDRDKN